MRCFGLKERELHRLLELLALWGIACGDETFQPYPLKVLRKVTREVAPLGVIAGKQ